MIECQFLEFEFESGKPSYFETDGQESIKAWSSLLGCDRQWSSGSFGTHRVCSGVIVYDDTTSFLSRDHGAWRHPDVGRTCRDQAAMTYTPPLSHTLHWRRTHSVVYNYSTKRGWIHLRYHDNPVMSTIWHPASVWHLVWDPFNYFQILHSNLS